MVSHVEIMVSGAANGGLDGGGRQYYIQTLGGVDYCLYADIDQQPCFRKSSDGGKTWSVSTVIFAGPVSQVAVWYDRWSGLSTDYIHIAFTRTDNSDVATRSINTASSDALGTQLVAFAGVSQVAPGGTLSIARARGGNILCAGTIDAGTEIFCVRATAVDGAWSSRTGVMEAASTLDQIILLPGWNADNQDCHAIFYDNSATEISVKRYDDSANSWAETSIATSMTMASSGASFPHFAAAVDLTNSQNLVVAWSAVDTLNADLRCFKVADASITETSANVVLNSTDDQGLCAIGIDNVTGYWHVFYTGKSDGSETFGTTTLLYNKVSKDGGATWGSETVMTGSLRSYMYLFGCPLSYYGPPKIMVNCDEYAAFCAIVPFAQPRTSYGLGL